MFRILGCGRLESSVLWSWEVFYLSKPQGVQDCGFPDAINRVCPNSPRGRCHHVRHITGLSHSLIESYLEAYVLGGGKGQGGQNAAVGGER